MKSKIIFYNIGNRDIKIKNIGTNSYRMITKTISEKNIKNEILDKEYDFSTPLIDALISYLKQDFLDEKEIENALSESKYQKNVKIIFFVTNQDQQHDKDTIYAGKILKEHLNHVFPYILITFIEIRENPANYDAMLKIFDHEISNIKLSIDYENQKRQETINTLLSQGTEILMALGPGTPAMNSALILGCIKYFPYNSNALYLYKGDSIFRLIDIHHLIHLERMKSYYLYLKEKGFFEAAVKLHDEYPEMTADLSGKRWQIHLDKIEAARVLFNYNHIISDIDELGKYQIPKKERIIIEKNRKKYSLLAIAQSAEQNLRELWKKEVINLTHQYFQTVFYFLEEIVYNIQIKLKQENYIDALGRIFRFEESALSLITEIIWKISYNEFNSKSDDFSKAVENNNALKEYFERNNIECSTPNTRTYLFMMKFILDTKNRSRENLGTINEIEKSHISKLEEIEQIISFLEIFKTLRNKSILAHGFEAISKKRLLKIYDDKITKGSNLTNQFGNKITQLRNNSDISRIFYLILRKTLELVHVFYFLYTKEKLNPIVL